MAGFPPYSPHCATRCPRLVTSQHRACQHAMAAISQDFRVACGMKHLAPTFVARLDSAEPRQARAALEALTTAWRSLRGDPQFAAVQGVLAEAGAVGSLVRLLRDGPAALRCQVIGPPLL